MGEDRYRNEEGRFKAQISDMEILEIVQHLEPAGTQEVADHLEISRQGADYRLRQLRNQGVLSSKKVGGTMVWLTIIEE